MALSNAEKQAAWRARQAANKRRVVELEVEVERLMADIAQLAQETAATKQAVKQARADHLRHLKQAMAIAHPDKGGDEESFIKAHAAYLKAKGRT